MTTNFTSNKYSKIYYQIVDRAINRILEGYTEKHHIIPKSMGGSNTVENLVRLTAREHFICHWLLIKMTEGKDRHKMINALRIMRAEKKGQTRYQTKITARVYENLKEEYALKNGEIMRKINTGRTQSAETIAKRVAKNTGKTRTKEFCEKMSKINKGRTKDTPSIETCLKISMANKGKSKPDGFGDKISIALSNVPKSENHKKKLAEAGRAYWATRKLAGIKND